MKQAISSDGAYVPLVGGEWAEVKRLSIGEVELVESETGVQVQTASLEPPHQAFCSLHPRHLPLPSFLCLLISLPLRSVLLPLIPGDGLFSSVRHIRPFPLLCSQKYDAHPMSGDEPDCCSQEKVAHL